MNAILKTGTTIIVLFATTMGNAQITKAKITATGLTCSMCSNAINKQLKKIPEVEKVETDLNSNTFTISLKKNNLSPNDLKKNIEKTGFFVGSMVVSVAFDNQTITPNTSVSIGNWTVRFINVTNKSLDGSVDLKILNKGFVTQKEYKKWAASMFLSPTIGNIGNNDEVYFVNLQL
jgi:copper chaperone CopZ